MLQAADFDGAVPDGETGTAAPQVQGSETVVDVGAAQRAVRDLLDAFGFDSSEDDLAETPRRVTAMLVELLTPQPFTMTTFANTENYDGLVLARSIPFHALCEHHLLPFIGLAHVGYLPGKRIIGLSKIARVVDYFARRLQVQERLTAQIAHFLEDELKPKGVGVVLEAEHQCLTLRGVQKPGTKTVTSMFLGALRNDVATRHEFFDERRTQNGGLRRSPFLVSRRETFNAAHQLRDPRLPEDENRRLFGKCVGMHGHNYVLEVIVCGDPDPLTGYVIDLKILSELIAAEIVEHVDHKNLNADVPWLAGRIPTAENLAVAFWDRLEPHLPAGILHAVRVCETDKNWVEYTGSH